ncbi:SirB2 family protein [Psychrobium sp. 1_MG-2023]|uniref:SirB2 family protein n=1 Tax=Psychrobium sp. 1_MG-2023 TaxID=3062624 RepID=UPI000C32C9C9|nr:SirB2 family protein [Psychrobium sp. 1_MG-2023]MDP2560939.1 SirB2 family protein [Psychrobium sp. 1_MG-2023]PKF56011.1 invasion protein [Alteromonadales bacterium alter-6D02]
MEQFYLPIKHLHLSLVAFSVLFFIIRAGLMFANKSIHQLRWAKMTSRIADTFLLASALTLCVIIGQYPFVDHWVTEKVVCIIAYIILAYIALYRATTTKTRILTSIGAVGWVLIAAKLAILKQALILG